MIPVGKFFVGSHHQGAPRYPSNVTNWRLYHVFGGVNWSTLIKPTQAQGEHTNSTQKGPIQPGSQTLNLLQLQLHLGQDFYKGKWLWRKGILDPFHFQCITRHKPKGMSTVWLSSKLLQNVNIIRANLFCQLYVCMHMWELLDQISLKYEGINGASMDRYSHLPQEYPLYGDSLNGKENWDPNTISKCQNIPSVWNLQFWPSLEIVCAPLITRLSTLTRWLTEFGWQFPWSVDLLYSNSVFPSIKLNKSFKYRTFVNDYASKTEGWSLLLLEGLSNKNAVKSSCWLEG